MEAVSISVQNLTEGLVSDEEASAIVSALSTQATRDYNQSSWVTDGLAAPIDSVTLVDPGAAPPPDTWHMELLLTSDQPGALGYHEEEALEASRSHGATSRRPHKASHRSSRGLRSDNPDLPLMKIFAQTAQEDGASIAEVCSHEMLEAAVDPKPMREIRTVRDTAKGRIVIVEVGDPVQECGYDSEGQTVADFALPAWFGYEQSEKPDQMSFRSSVRHAFELAPGGYISYAPEDTPEEWQQEKGS